VTALGTSFARWRAEDLGLDYRETFARICAMDFAVIRLSASWREVAEFGWGHLDWLLGHAEAVGQPIVLTVGMKALAWPEFYLPEGLDPADLAVQRRAVSHIAEAVRRFGGHTALVAWQVENEPFNRSGPQGRWLPRRVVRSEAQAVRSVDERRPIMVTTFGHFSEGLDRASSHNQSEWKRRFRLALPAEREALAILHRGDILGVDIYRSIGWVDSASQEAQVGRALDDQMQWVSRWQRIAREQGKRFWVTEAQAEPWEARRETHANPLTVAPSDIPDLIAQLAGLRIETVLLWGSEYWLWRERNGDSRWMEAVALGRRALA
jgi:hypothetical protein